MLDFRSIVRILFQLVLASALGFGAAASSELPAWSPDANVERDKIPALYRWDLTPLFASDEDWQRAAAGLENALSEMTRFRGKLDDPKMLHQALDTYFRMHDSINHVTLYANLRLAVDESGNVAAAMNQRGLALMDRFMQEAAFVRDALLKLSDEALETLYRENPGVEEHRRYIDNLRRRRSRLLGEEAERVLGLAGDNLWAEIDLNELPSPHEDTFRTLLAEISWPTIQDESGNPVQLTLANYGRYRASKDREVRRQAVAAVLGTLRTYRRTLASTLAGQFRLDVTYARARGYDTALEAYLDKDDVAPAVVENLIETVNANLGPLHRYVELRKKALGLDELHLHDLYVPMVPHVDDEVTFAEAQQILIEALAPLGEEYGALLVEGLDPRNGWIDLYPHAGKQSGAFSASVYGRHPYILMNYQDSADDMSTLAHEFGHAIHSHLAMTSQPYSSFRYVPFLAEIASTCNEALLNDHLVATADDRSRKASLLNERLENTRTTIYRQTLFAEFERAVHSFVESGTPVTADLLDETYADLVRRYYGPGFTVGPDDGLEWAYIPHFYYKYYVYTYATGLSSGIALAERVRGEGPKAADAFLDMLRGGNSRPPLELLESAGVDLRKPDAIEAALRDFSRTVDALDRLLSE